MGSFQAAGKLPSLHVVRTVLYTLLLLVLQVQWVARLPLGAMRVDLLLPLMFGVAVEWPPIMSLAWALLWGFVADTLSGQFWGFHVGTYVVVICIVNIALERFEFHNPFYQMFFVGISSVLQSMALGFFLVFDPSSSMEVVPLWMSLSLRSVFMTILSPLIIYPVWSARRRKR